jgi:hemerythrin-like domain-containing protein
MEAFEQLRSDHVQARMLLVNLGRACQTALDRAQGLFATIRRELEIHAQLEQKLLYPALRSIVPARVDQAEEDHRLIEQLLAQMQEHSLQDPEFGSWVWDLAENVEHHIELQENGLFAVAQDRLSAPVLEELEQEMRNLRGALTRAALAGK